jgi:hypothetical protein
MRRALIVLVVSMGLIAGIAAQAEGASTRAEYVAQVDPICQAFAGPQIKAGKAFTKNYKLWVRDLSHGTLKNWVRQTDRTARSLRHFDQIHASLTDQIAGVPPLPDDAGTVDTWLNDRRQADAFSEAAASAFGHFKFDRFRRLVRRANQADGAGADAISGFGFQVCGVTV